MKRPPSQARSVASTNRMLDAAESLFAAGGAEAVTIEAVVRQSETSVGSFYARFINRDGLLAAMHGRFIENFETEAKAAIAVAVRQPTIERALLSFTKQAFESARRNRESILFFVATSATDTSLRHPGLAANPGFAAAFAAVILPFRDQINHKKPELAIDITFRIFFAMFIQRALFTPREATGRAITDTVLAREITNCLILYLISPATLS